MTKLQFQAPQFDDHQKIIINELWDHFVSIGYEAGFLNPGCPAGYASSIFYSFNGDHYEFHVRENNLRINIDKWLNNHKVKMENIILISEINNMKTGKDLLNYINKKVMAKENEELEKIKNK
jgi:hypothetical protein